MKTLLFCIWFTLILILVSVNPDIKENFNHLLSDAAFVLEKLLPLAIFLTAIFISIKLVFIIKNHFRNKTIIESEETQ